MNKDALKFFGLDITTPTPVIVLDFHNRSKFTTGMLGRTFADALSIELLNTRTFEVVKRAQLDQALAEANLTIPMSWEAQSMLAERLKCPFTISGEIESVDILKSRDGTYAEVVVTTLVVSKITKLPVNGARVVQRSSPKVGYSGSPDVLVHEALSTAAFQVSQRLLDNRLPIATVLVSPQTGEVVVRGGSTMGLRKGMILISMRRETVTGRLRLIRVGPSDSLAAVLEDSRGIAPGDKALPVFELDATLGLTKESREQTGMRLAGIAALGLLASFVGTNGSNEAKDSPTIAPLAYPMADAAIANRSGYAANIVRWSYMGDRVAAYIIYRDTNPYAPIAVVNKDTTEYIDSAEPLRDNAVMESTEITVDITPESGAVETFERTVTYEDTDEDRENPEEQVDDASFSVTCRRIPLTEGESCGYQVRVLYVNYAADGLDDELGHPDEHKLVLGSKSPSSPRITLVSPPVLDTPLDTQVPIEGTYRCLRVLGATAYRLQLSIDSTFSAGKTIEVPAYVQSQTAVLATKSLSSLLADADFASAPQIFWRMGAKVFGEIDPQPKQDPNQQGWVFSTSRVFNPGAGFFVLRSTRTAGQTGTPHKTGLSGRQERGRGLLRR